METRFQQGKVYKIVNDIDDEIYVGSTTNKYLSNRMCAHRMDCKQRIRKSKLYQKMRSFGIEHFTIVLLENFPCNSKYELTQREEYWKRILKSTLNSRSCIVYASKRDYRQANKDKIKKWKQNDYQRHREQRLEQKKMYYQSHKKEIARKSKSYRARNKLKIQQQKKTYREANKNKISQHDKQYYQEHKAKILARMAEEVECDCGAIMRRGSLSNHRKTASHKEFMQLVKDTMDYIDKNY